MLEISRLAEELLCTQMNSAAWSYWLVCCLFISKWVIINVTSSLKNYEFWEDKTFYRIISLTNFNAQFFIH